MQAAFASAARFLAFADAAPVELRDIEDLHHTDLDGVLADRLAEGYAPARSATALARLVGDPGRAALLAHDLGGRAARLAVR
jgi:hypothetical protein